MIPHRGGRPRIVTRGHELEAIIRRCTWFLDVLSALDDARLPDAWVGAGILRTVVWDELFGTGFDPQAVLDVDVAFFDPDDCSPQREARAVAALRVRRTGVAWDATNQAAVHLSYQQEFGLEVPALLSTLDGITTWPETATAVAVRWDAARVLEVAAPLGLDDLLDGVWRWNPRRVPWELYQQRLIAKRPLARWPGLRIVGDGPT